MPVEYLSQCMRRPQLSLAQFELGKVVVGFVVAPKHKVDSRLVDVDMANGKGVYTLLQGVYSSKGLSPGRC
jgi:hypothetical protein